jgi:hypothetical protein
MTGRRRGIEAWTESIGHKLVPVPAGRGEEPEMLTPVAPDLGPANQDGPGNQAAGLGEAMATDH